MALVSWTQNLSIVEIWCWAAKQFILVNTVSKFIYLFNFRSLPPVEKISYEKTTEMQSSHIRIIACRHSKKCAHQRDGYPCTWAGLKLDSQIFQQLFGSITWSWYNSLQRQKGNANMQQVRILEYLRLSILSGSRKHVNAYQQHSLWVVIRRLTSAFDILLSYLLDSFTELDKILPKGTWMHFV